MFAFRFNFGWVSRVRLPFNRSGAPGVRSLFFISVTGFGSSSWFPVWTLEIPTTYVNAKPGGRREGSQTTRDPYNRRGSGGVSESPRGEYGEMSGWSHTISREPAEGRVLG